MSYNLPRGHWRNGNNRNGIFFPWFYFYVTLTLPLQDLNILCRGLFMFIYIKHTENNFWCYIIYFEKTYNAKNGMISPFFWSFMFLRKDQFKRFWIFVFAWNIESQFNFAMFSDQIFIGSFFSFCLCDQLERDTKILRG